MAAQSLTELFRSIRNSVLVSAAIALTVYVYLVSPFAHVADANQGSIGSSAAYGINASVILPDHMSDTPNQ